MKYLKTYESFKYNYWTIDLSKSDIYFEACLDKLGVNDEDKESILYDKALYSEDNEKAAIVSVSENGWQWSSLYIMNIMGSEHMGEITASDEEIEDYIIKKNSEKYNL